jgi:ribosome biogenesis GTPase
MFLNQIGADARIRESIRPFEAEGMELGRVSFAAHEQYRVYLEAGEFEAVPAGRLRWDDELPVVGDWIAARRLDRSLVWMESVLPRRACFSRQAAGNTTAEQILAANIDLALIVCGLDNDFNPRRLERYLVLAQESGAEAAVVLNKLDICDCYPERVAAVQQLAPAARVFAISALHSGIVEPLQTLVRGRTVVLLGSSGAGKSTIVNGLLQRQSQPTAPVRASDSRGRHTTTSRMLQPLPQGGAIVDTPGMRELQLWATEDSLEQVFQDVLKVAERCKFGNCSHLNEPDCAVREALETGSLDRLRWESYRKLQQEIRRHSRSRLEEVEEKKRWKSIHKEMRKHPKYNR